MNVAILKNNNKLINNYTPNPTLPFDVEGKIVEKSGKDIKLEKTIENKIFEYSLRLKDEVTEKVGQTVKIDKTDIVSYNVEEKKEEKSNKTETVNVEKALRELGLEYTSENVRMIESLLRNGIKITKGNVDSYVKSKSYLRKIIDDIDIEKTIKLREMGLDLEDDSLQKIAESLDEIEDERFSFKKLLKLDRDIDYKQAEKISKEIYGQRMGKDVYDSIIALKREKIPITKENVDRTLDTMKKINNLKHLEDKTYVKFIEGEIEFNIDNLYKIKNQYTSSRIESSKDVSLFEDMTVKSQANIDSLKQVLREMGLEDNLENIIILREFIDNDMDMTNDSYKQLVDMKDVVGELLTIIEDNGISSMIINESDLKENIYTLVEKFKSEALADKDLDFNFKDNTNSLDNDIRKYKETSKEDHSFKILESIGDKDLIELIKKGEDFNLKNIFEIKQSDIDIEQSNKSIEYKTVEKTQTLINIFKSLGDNLNSDIISRSNSLSTEISLESLDIANKQENKLTNTKNIEEINKEKTLFIQSEYIRIKNTLTTNVIKDSLLQGKVIEKMPLEQLNPYIQKSLNKYKETYEMTKDIKNINGKEEKLIPIIMKNNLEMTLKELKNLDSFLDGEKNITNTIRNELLSKDVDYSDEFKEGIKTLQKNISEDIKNGVLVEEDYNKLMNSMSGQDSSSGDNNKEQAKKDHLKIKDMISKKDMIFQLPIEIGDGYKTLNIIVPNAKAGINKNDMNFFISLETENLGKINMDISVKDKNIYINLDEEENLLEPMMSDLKSQINSIGYKLVEKSDR